MRKNVSEAKTILTRCYREALKIIYTARVYVVLLVGTAPDWKATENVWRVVQIRVEAMRTWSSSSKINCPKNS